MPACRMDWVYTGLGSERSASRTMFWCGRPYPITFQPQRITLNSFLTIQVTCLDVHLKLMPGANEVLILFLAVGH